MKKRKNGFTFAELLGVITIIGILALIVLPTIERVTKENKEKIYQTQLNNIILSLKSWASDNKLYLPKEDGEILTITLGNLKADGYIEYDVKNPKTDKCFDNEMILQITKVNNNYEYKIDLDTIKETDHCEVDVDKPLLVLNGNMIENVEVNSVYVDNGVTAKDKDGNDITSSVITTISGSGNVIDTSKLGNSYIITYSVTANEKTSTISRTVKIIDTTAPILTIPGNVVLTTEDTTFDLLSGVSATDNSGETIEVATKSNITFGIAGTYTITYTAKDSSGNTTTKKRIVTISSLEEKKLSDLATIETGVSIPSCVTDGSTCTAGTQVAIKVNDTTVQNFYVISETNGEVILIMDSNLEDNVEWYADADNNSYGPTTAVAALKERTSDWTNIEEREYTYSDDGGGNMYTAFTETMRARMLTYTEATDLGCTTTSGSCPSWLYTNLYNTGLNTDDSGHSIYGYWTSAAYASNSHFSWYVTYYGIVLSTDTNNTNIGIRPVITLTK